MEQFKCINDLREYIKELEKEKGRVLSRACNDGTSRVFYRPCDTAPNDEIVQGIRVRDFCFSNCRHWVEPHPQMGLSFSANWQNLKAVYKHRERLNKKMNINTPINVFWILEKADIPQGLEFVPDKSKPKEHYYLRVTEKMTVEKLVSKLKWVADKMSKITDLRGIK